MYQIHSKLHHLINIISGLHRLFESKKNYENMLQNAPFPKIFRGSMPPNPLANAWLRNASQAPSPQKNSCPPPLANPAYAYELLLRNLFENPSCKTVDCV